MYFLLKKNECNLVLQISYLMIDHLVKISDEDTILFNLRYISSILSLYCFLLAFHVVLQYLLNSHCSTSSNTAGSKNQICETFASTTLISKIGTVFSCDENSVFLGCTSRSDHALHEGGNII